MNPFQIVAIPWRGRGAKAPPLATEVRAMLARIQEGKQMADMKTISFHARRGVRTLHIETDLGIVNVSVGLRDRRGRTVTHIEVLPDEIVGEPAILRRGPANVTLVQAKKARR